MPDWLSATKDLLSTVWAWIQNHPWNWVSTHPWISGIAAFLLTFGKKVWSKLEPKAVDLIAESVEHRVAVFLTGYRKLYAKHLYYKHRTFDVKGFSTQGKFALELENVYVDLDVDPAALNTITQHPLRLPKDAENSNDRSIFVWLKADPEHPRNFAIVGPPGSGKTTLLKHLALSLAARKAPIRYTPVLLFLRDHAAAIPGVHVVHGSAGDHDHVKAASGRLQKDGRRGAADLNAAADQGGGDGGIQRDQHQLDVESVSGKQALIPGDEQSREADGVGIADAELRGGLRRDADTGQCHHAGPSPGRENTSHGSPPCLSNGTMPIINFFVNNIDKSN